MPQGLPTVVPNQIIESAHINAIADRIVGRFANTAERDAAITVPVNGMICITNDTGRMWQRKSGVWIAVGGSRAGCNVSASQSVGTGVTGTIAFINESQDTDNFHAPNSTDLVIPAGLDGVYAYTVHVDAGGTLNGVSTCLAIVGGTQYVGYAPIGNRLWVVSAQFLAFAGTICKAQIYNGHSGAATFTVRAQLWRVSD